MNNTHIAETALNKLKSLHVDAAEISIGETKGFSVSARLGDVETLEHYLDKSFSVTVFQNQCTGSASSSDFSIESINATIEKACTIANFSSPDPFAGLADPKRLAKKIPDCDLYHFWNITPQEAIELAIACEKKALNYSKKIVNSEGANVSTINSTGIYANTLGFLGEFQVSEHSISCSVVGSDDQQMQRDYEYTVARNPADLLSIDFVAEHAAEKTIKRLGARKIKTQTCPVIFEASVAKSLLHHFVQAISGGNLYRQSSFLLNMLGKPIFPAFINIFQQPHLLSAMGSAAFDQEGVATVDQHYIKNGELVNYALGSYSARKLGMQSTGNAGGVFNFSISDTDVTLQQLMKKMHRGLLVTELMGQGLNITTGDYSRGASGFWIDNGEIQFPVEEITIAGNLKNIFADVVAIANDTDTRSSIRTGSILIDHMTVAGD
ncbi:MAG TPA: metalloprotease PmbA [Coxiellaceae bacterium]|nr:MAG: metalloprotease PmbA [Gammaproteobacteria bacterium RIFCSPHIGHO2_12_FULL_36_30]HLB56862.1 metalloprotease PmbA [Coxiellaceae bacterium]